VTNVDALVRERVEVGGEVATRVLPSPVFISAMRPRWRMAPPITWTSKWRNADRALRRLTHHREGFGRTSSRVAPPATRARSSGVLALSASSESDSVCASRAATASTRGRIFLTSRSFFEPITLEMRLLSNGG